MALTEESYKHVVKDVGSFRLKHILRILEICRTPKRICEIKREIGWYADRVKRFIRFMLLLNLLEERIVEGKRLVKTYETTLQGLQVLERNKQFRRETKPGSESTDVQLVGQQFVHNTNKGRVIEILAEKAGVSDETIRQAFWLKKHASEEELEQLRRGEAFGKTGQSSVSTDVQPAHARVARYGDFYRKHGLVKLRDIATLLESCQFPARFSEIKRRTGWREHKLIRLLRTLISMGLVERVELEQGRGKHPPVRAYAATELGLQVLRSIEKTFEKEGFQEAPFQEEL